MTEFTTPEQDKEIGELRMRLVEWIAQATLDGYDTPLVLTTLMMFAASGAVSSRRVERDEFLKVMGMYFDMYVRDANAEVEKEGPKPS